MDRKSWQAGAAQGFSLIELIMVLVISSTLLLVGAPVMWKVIQLNQLRTQTNRLLTAINLTRSEAVLRNIPVSMCPSSTLATGEATCSGNFADGWFVFTNRDRDRVVDPGRDEVLGLYEALPSGYTLTNRSGTRAANEIITYFPDGSSPRNRTLLLCPPGVGQRMSRSIVMNIVGRPRVDDDWGMCPGS